MTSKVENTTNKSKKKKKKKKKTKKKSIPLAPPPEMNSRKRARIVTTLFHKHTRNRDIALQENDYERAQECEDEIEKIGGREEYQRASVCSTKHHSTSKWVLKVLARMRWLNGISKTDNDNEGQNETTNEVRHLEVLEVGAINTDLLNAASRKRTIVKKKRKASIMMNTNKTTQTLLQAEMESVRVPYYKLNVKAIDIRSMHEDIEEVDFLQLPYRNTNVDLRYDTIVCSMVINCVTTPDDRGKMLFLLYHHLRPGGLCFLTLPRLCLYQSAYITMNLFQEILTKGIGFAMEETKESPKVAFFILKRPEKISTACDGDDDDAITKRVQEFPKKWNTVKTVNRGKKYRNTFSIVLNKNNMI